jgi:hypothetical protein
MATKKKTEEVVEVKVKKTSTKKAKVEKPVVLVNGTGKTWAQLEAEHANK